MSAGRWAYPYPAELVAKVKELYDDGATQKEIAASFGVWQATVSKLLRSSGIPTRRTGATEKKKGANNGRWLGDAAGYRALHERVKLARGRPSLCEECGDDDPKTRYEWANISGRFTDVSDYRRMCCTCHKRRDRELRRQRYAAAERDAARLTWLEQRVHGTGETLSMGGVCSWGITIGRKRIGSGDDLREAIDDAMQVSERGGAS